MTATSPTTEAITLPESKRLIALESTIEAGRKIFVEVGLALAEIRDARLYRSDYATFEDYCKGKWGWTKQHVYRLIECAPIAESNPQVTSVNQARELAKVEPAKRVEVITKAAAAAPKGKLTAAGIRTAAAPASPPPTPGSGSDLKRRFPAAATSQRRAERWWYHSATPEKRGLFFSMMIHMHRPVAVPDKEQFTKSVMRWLAEDVRQVEAGA